MKYSLSNAQMRKADADAISAGTPAAQLMERAGKALADVVERAMARHEADALFVCGGGNNGGDGFVAARILSERGKDVSVLCLADKFSDECLRAKERFCGEILGRMPRRRYALIVDCIFGTGLTRAPEGAAKELIEFITNSGAYVISCDLPSGLSENGIAFEACVVADETVVMSQVKNALLLADGADVAGKITVVDIGIPAIVGAEIWEDSDAARIFPKRKSNVNKGAFGSAAILAGGAKGSGAAFLAAGASLKSGAGYTRLYVSKELYPYAIGRLPAVILHDFQGIDDELLALQCIAIGMGMGVSEELYGLISELLQKYRGTLVLDADALNTISRYGVGVLERKKCHVILTPHVKEFSRLIDHSVEEVLHGAVEHALAFAEKYGVTVVLKNNRTIITDGTRMAINTTGSAVLAKGGSGDVLSGFLAGTCARGVSAFEASAAACYMLGRAGELAEKELGEYAPDASDMIQYLPKAILSVLK